MNQEEIFKSLFTLDVNGHTEKKKSGNTTLTYLSWAWAWSEVKRLYPEATYEILKFENNLPYVYDENTGYMVFTKVTIGKLTHEMWLPVMDGANKAMKNQPYTYQVKEYKNKQWTGNYIEKNVEAATMFDVNKTIMRCLVKNLAMFGLGLYIYAGEDLPEMPSATKEQIEELKALFEEAAALKNRAPKTFENQVLAYFQYGGKLEDVNETMYEQIKKYTESGIEQMKAAKENNEK
ncbi:DUF1071 domain-containing protein [Enterococcus mediterraneensis]|uniref:Sak single strand annealing protein n=1 Tax=Enterococcus mediterraneensis TaxID=2364791 RepID=UPI000F062660|nr:DUF1071 domain-containing protein [Enterococcus mediterraneensis]